MKHLWAPAIVLGTAGTAGLIRILRNNLLDELAKPYVVAARARGVPEWKLVVKYPVRIALNPFISTVGYLWCSITTNYRGPIPPELGDLTDTLKRLRLSNGNRFTGAYCQHWETWTSMT